MVEENEATSYSSELAVNQPASLLEMAQKVHDDFVEKGRATAEALESEAQKKHDELISSAKEFHDITMLESESRAATIIEDAQLSAFTLISDAKVKADGIVSDAHEKTVNLEASILKLQEFESAYRANLLALVSSAQATLAVPELEVEEPTELPHPEVEAPAAETVNFAEIIDRALDPNADVVLVGAVRDIEPEQVESTEAPAEDASQEESVESHSEKVDESDEDVDSSEEETPSAEDDSEELEDSTDDIESEESPVIYTVQDASPESFYYDPTEVKSPIDESTVASILSQSGLVEGESLTSNEAPSVIINTTPPAGWELNTDDIQPDVDSDENSSDEDSADSEDSDTDVKKDKEEK